MQRANWLPSHDAAVFQYEQQQGDRIACTKLNTKAVNEGRHTIQGQNKMSSVTVKTSSSKMSGINTFPGLTDSG